MTKVDGAAVIDPIAEIEITSMRRSEIERAARRLQEKIEHLDPEGEEWENLSDHQREFYRLCVEDLTDAPAMLWLALQRASDYVITTEVSKRLASQGGAMTEMIGRVAKAIHDTQCSCGSWPGHSPEQSEGWINSARAAIEAMREPTKAMIDEAWASAEAERADLVWEDMIDEALGRS